MRRLVRSVRAAALLLCAAATLTSAQSTLAQNESDPAYKSKFADVGDVRLHYLDFGGNGLPILFIHSASRSASTWKNFAPRFTDRHRVLAITAWGHGKSEGKQADVATRVRDILGLLDTLGIERAVFIGNSRPARDMTYLAEHHSSRVAGLVYLANAPSVDGLVEADTTGAFEMSLRAAQGELPPSYRPEYVRSSGTDIDVPALTFVASTGTRGWVNSNYPLTVAKWVSEKGVDWIADSEAKAFLKRLASDEDLQRRVRASWKENVVPALRENEKAFKRAFGKDLRVVKLDVPSFQATSTKTHPRRLSRTFGAS